MRRAILTFVSAVFAVFALASTADELVKMSSSKVCHSESSPYYDRLKNFTPYQSMARCLASGGRQAKSSGSGKSESKDPSSYKRSDFGRGWADFDKDCQNTRHEILAEKSTTKPRWDARGCSVIAGQWISFFSGKRFYDAEALDIDHIVPLKWAWDHGASSWNDRKREQFANDPRNLEPVEASLNRSKGAKGPLKWLPPSNQCSYVAKFKRLVVMYKLELSKKEQSWFDRKLASC